MNRNKLFDKILMHLIENKNNYWILVSTSEKYFGVTDRRLIESIGDELIQRGWATSKNRDKYSVNIHYDGIQMMEKHGSYSSFIRAENRQDISSKWSSRLLTAKTIVTIITTIGMLFLAVLKFYDNKKIDAQVSEIKQLNGTIDSLKLHLDKRTTTTVISNSSDFQIDEENSKKNTN